MKLRYTPDMEIINQLISIAEKKGEVKAYFLNNLEPRSREKNKIDSVHATIALQGSSLTREATRDIMDGLPLTIPSKMIREVKNTIQVYEMLSTYNPLSQDSIKTAYQNMSTEPGTAGSYRKEAGPIFYWNRKIGMSVPPKEMKTGMSTLFHYLRHNQDPMLIKSSLCHYAIHYYQPFDMLNEKMGRIWQTLLLMKEHPAFEFLPWEKQLLSRKKEYNIKLGGMEQNRDASEFIRFMLDIINQALSAMLESCRKTIRPMDRIRYFYTLHRTSFTRKDYMLVHKNISMTTASRDLELAVESGFFERYGKNNQSKYTCRLLFE